MGLIAEASGVTKPTVYAHFRSKQRLLDALMQRWLTAVLRAATVRDEQGADLPAVLDKMGASIGRIVRSDAYRALGHALHAPGLLTGAPLERWNQRFSAQREMLAGAFAAAGAADAVERAEMFLILLERSAAEQDSAWNEGSVVRLFTQASAPSDARRDR